ncbi:MAG: TIR domain-containing protein [Ruminococcus sp.]|nr:TIR domain-containing protein [Ruminococcus sp.]
MYNIFISHSWSYSDYYDKLISLLDSESSLYYRDYSVPKNDPIHNANNDRELRAAIKNQMQHASCVLILAGVYSTYSKWINIEIDLAQEMGKRIIAIEPWGSERTSTVVKSNANKVVKWNTSSIVNAIKGY